MWRKKRGEVQTQTRVKIQLYTNAPLTFFGQCLTALAYSIRIAIYLYQLFGYRTHCQLSVATG
jgi:hypothetical protein